MLRTLASASRAGAQKREAPRGQSFAVFGRGRFDAFAFAGVFNQGMLGRQALEILEKLCGLRFGVTEGLERGDDFVLVGVGCRIAERFDKIARKNGGVGFGAGLGRSDHHALGLLEDRERAAARAGHINHQLVRRESCRAASPVRWPGDRGPGY